VWPCLSAQPHHQPTTQTDQRQRILYLGALNPTGLQHAFSCRPTRQQTQHTGVTLRQQDRRSAACLVLHSCKQLATEAQAYTSDAYAQPTSVRLASAKDTEKSPCSTSRGGGASASCPVQPRLKTQAKATAAMHAPAELSSRCHQKVLVVMPNSFQLRSSNSRCLMHQSSTSPPAICISTDGKSNSYSMLTQACIEQRAAGAALKRRPIHHTLQRK